MHELDCGMNCCGDRARRAEPAAACPGEEEETDRALTRFDPV
jgi:hypothetical protein